MSKLKYLYNPVYESMSRFKTKINLASSFSEPYQNAVLLITRLETISDKNVDQLKYINVGNSFVYLYRRP